MIRTPSFERIPKEILANYDVEEWRHACAILQNDFPQEWHEIVEILSAFRLRKSSILKPGGGLSPISRYLNEQFQKKGWKETQFKTAVLVDSTRHDSPTHRVDCFKNGVALEVEWNNKTEFYDRDLNNFRLLFDLRTVSVGVIVTRCDELDEIFERLGKYSSYGTTSTHLSRLKPRIEGGSGGGCPLLVFGIKPSLYLDDSSEIPSPAGNLGGDSP